MLQKLGQKKVILPLLAIFLVNLALFSLPGLPGSRPVILASAENLTIPDMKGIYSPEYVYGFLESIGPAGRSAYQSMHYTTDLVFPLVYGALLFALLCRAVQKSQTKVQWLPFIAFFPTIIDLAENFTFVYITNHFPVFLPELTRIAQVFTIAKFSGIGLCLLMVIYLQVKKPLSSREVM